MTSAIRAGGVHCEKSAVGIAARFAGVSIVVGAIVFTRTPRSATSFCRISANDSTARFAVA